MKKARALKDITDNASINRMESSYLYIDIPEQLVEAYREQIERLDAQLEPSSSGPGNTKEYSVRFDSDWFVKDFNSFFHEIVCSNVAGNANVELDDYFFYGVEPEDVAKCYSDLKNWYQLLEQVANHVARNDSRILTFWLTTSW